MAILPSEILLDEILPKLPVKSLLRFKSVSKQFKTLISSPNFILHHLRHSLSSATNRLLITSGSDGLHSSDIDSPENPPVPLPLPEFFNPDPECSIIGCCNGLLLLRGAIFNDNFMLINPSTGFYTVIPYGIRPAFFSSYGFGYDPINDDYKIVILDINGFYVVNLKDKLWRNLGNDLDEVPVDRQVAAVCNNQLCHWLIWCELQEKHRIVCFDVCIENWTQDIPLPDYNDNSADNSGNSPHFVDLLLEACGDKRNDVTALQVMNGFLSVLTRNNRARVGYDLWVMKEYGIKESWVKFGFWDPNCTPLAFGRGLNSKVLCKDRVRGKYRVKWYNVREKQYNDAEIHNIHGVEHLYQVCVVNGSLVTVPGGKRIRDNGQGGQ